jgi:hypothetical protein
MAVYPSSLKIREKFLAGSDWADSVARMIQTGFLSQEDREKLIAMTRDGSLTHRFARRANALVLFDEGWSCRQAAHAFLLDDGVFEIALRYRGDDFRAHYAVKIDANIRVIHAFQKKS